MLLPRPPQPRRALVPYSIMKLTLVLFAFSVFASAQSCPNGCVLYRFQAGNYQWVPLAAGCSLVGGQLTCQGSQGPPGPQGATGPQGPPGVLGATGPGPATLVWLDSNGNPTTITIAPHAGKQTLQIGTGAFVWNPPQ